MLEINQVKADVIVMRVRLCVFPRIMCFPHTIGMRVSWIAAWILNDCSATLVANVVIATTVWSSSYT